MNFLPDVLPLLYQAPESPEMNVAGLSAKGVHQKNNFSDPDASTNVNKGYRLRLLNGLEKLQN